MAKTIYSDTTCPSMLFRFIRSSRSHACRNEISSFFLDTSNISDNCSCRPVVFVIINTTIFVSFLFACFANLGAYNFKTSTLKCRMIARSCVFCILIFKPKPTEKIFSKVFNKHNAIRSFYKVHMLFSRHVIIRT